MTNFELINHSPENFAFFLQCYGGKKQKFSSRILNLAQKEIEKEEFQATIEWLNKEVDMSWLNQEEE